MLQMLVEAASNLKRRLGMTTMLIRPKPEQLPEEASARKIFHHQVPEEEAETA